MATPKPKKPKTLRNRQLAKIHILREQTGMSDEAYAAALINIGGVAPDAEPSARRLDALGLAHMLDHLSRLAGIDPWRPDAADILANPQLQKIDALLLDAQRGWGYILDKGDKRLSMLKQITKRDHLRFCTAADLAKLISALQIDADRRAAKGAQP